MCFKLKNKINSLKRLNIQLCYAEKAEFVFEIQLLYNFVKSVI